MPVPFVQQVEAGGEQRAADNHGDDHGDDSAESRAAPKVYLRSHRRTSVAAALLRPRARSSTTDTAVSARHDVLIMYVLM